MVLPQLLAAFSPGLQPQFTRAPLSPSMSDAVFSVSTSAFDTVLCRQSRQSSSAVATI